MGADQMTLALERMCLLLLERAEPHQPLNLLGIQPRGVPVAQSMARMLRQIDPGRPVLLGLLDITFFRDDIRKAGRVLHPYPNRVDFSVEDQYVLLVDDVLYTGRTIQAAMMALQPYGRPARLELAVLIDRRFNRHLPIQPNIIGLRVDAVDSAYVQVNWHLDSDNQPQPDSILIFPERQ